MFNEETEPWGPNEDVINIAHSPIALFFLTIPKQFWRTVALETTRYELQTRSSRILEHERKYSNLQHLAYLSRVNNFRPVEAWEIVHYIALLIAHASNPRNDLKNHWRKEVHQKYVIRFCATLLYFSLRAKLWNPQEHLASS